MGTTITLPDELYERVCALASKQGVSVEDFVREAVAAKAEAAGIEDDLLSKLPFIGIADSGYTDTSQRASEEGLPGLHPWRS